MRIHPTHAVLCLLFSLLAPVQAAQPSQRVGPETAMAAYRELESWVRAWDVPESAPIDLSENATGVSVTLRLGGVIVGRGAHMRADAEALRDAAHMAWVEANQRINVERDALRRDRLLETAQRLRIELEIAGPLTPLFGDSEQDAAGDVSPGRHGVAARRGPRVEGVFPGAMLASNTGPAQAMRSALASLGYPLEPLSDLRTAQGVIVYRFESSHLAQLAPDGAPIFLSRGGRIVQQSEVTAASLRAFGERLAAHIVSRRWPGNEPLGLMGVYRPWVGDYEEPIVAQPREQAMAALALARWSRTSRAPDAHLRLEDARAVLHDLADVHEGEPDPVGDAGSAAMLVLALREAYDIRADETPVALDRLRARAVGRLRSAYSEAGGFDGELAPAERALVACALAAEFGEASATRMLLRDTAPPALPELMPWLGWAELLLHPVSGGSEPPAGVALENFRSLVWRHQLSALDLDPGDADLAGGVVFTGARLPLPTAQTLRPLAFIATMFGDDRLTDSDQAAQQLARLSASLRFVMQLAAGDVEGHMYLDPDRARGGVRNALWDQRMRLEAGAMALLTVTETLRSVERRTARPAAANNERGE